MGLHDLFLGKQGDWISIGLEEAKSYYCFFDSARYTDNLFSELAIDCPAEIARSVRQRRAEYLAGRHCASRALRSAGVTSSTIVSSKNGCPVWPPEIQGSITHCEGFAMAAVSDASTTAGVGIDVEPVISAQVMSEIWSQTIVGREEQIVFGADAPPEFLFTIMFSIKECFFKAAYPTTMRFFGFEAAEVEDIDLRAKTVRIRLTERLNGLWRQGDVYNGFFSTIDDRILTSLLLPRTARPR